MLTEGQICIKDSDCPVRQYCYSVSATCVDYIFCDRYNRFEAAKYSREPSQCGSCMKGYAAEILATGENASYCAKVATENIASTANDTLTHIVIVICTIIAILLLAIILVVYFYFKKRPFNRDRTNSIESNEQNSVLHQDSTVKATAPPEEQNSPIFNKVCKKGKYCLPQNNNINAKDNNTLVAARPFMPPTWVSNANMDSDDSDNDSIDSPAIANRLDNQQNIVSQSPIANNNLNINCSSAHVTIQLPQLTTEHEDNARNIALTQTHSITTGNAGSADSIAGNPTNENADRNDGTKTSNILINQINNLTMNLKL